MANKFRNVHLEKYSEYDTSTFPHECHNSNFTYLAELPDLGYLRLK